MARETTGFQPRVLSISPFPQLYMEGGFLRDPKTQASMIFGKQHQGKKKKPIDPPILS